MMWKTLLPVTAGIVMLSAVGCTSPLYSLIRGQSPDGSAESIQPAAHRSGAILYGEGAQEIQGCPTGGCNGDCNNGGCGNGLRLVYRRHHHQSDYRVRFGETTFGHGANGSYGLVYPPKNAPHAVVQYPYYTLRGPTDFFFGMKESTDY